nr:hypothetical protein [Variovorax gossypii]
MDSTPWGIPPGLFPDRGARVRLHGRFDRSRGMPVAVDEPADDLDRHGPNMRAGIFRQQFHRPRKNLGLLRLARSLLATIASQCVQCRDPHALIGVVQHCEQVRQRVGLQVSVEKPAAVKTHVGIAMPQPGTDRGKRSRSQLQQAPVGGGRPIRHGQHLYQVGGFV